MKIAQKNPAFTVLCMVFAGLLVLAGCTTTNPTMPRRGFHGGDSGLATGAGAAVGSRVKSPVTTEKVERFFIEIGVAGIDPLTAGQSHSGDISGGSIFDDTTRSRLKREVYLKPGNWKAHYHLGLFYMSRAEFEQAEKSLHKAMEYKGSPRLLYNALGTLYESMGNQEKAMDFFKSALDLKSSSLARSSSLVMMNAASTYMRSGQLNKAEKLIRRADLTELSSKPVFNYNMTLILYQTEQYDEALERIEKTIAAGREDYLVRYTKASVLVKLNRYNEALETFGQLKAERPGDARLYKNMGVIYELYLGDMARALQNYVGYIGIVGEDNAGEVTLWADVVRSRIARLGGRTTGSGSTTGSSTTGPGGSQ